MARKTAAGGSTLSKPRSGSSDLESEDMLAILELARRGDAQANRQLFAALYENLRLVARGVMRHEQPGQTLEPTALVHEVFLSLSRSSVSWVDRRHFFAVASRAMRRVLVDHARSRKQRRKTLSARGERQEPVLVEYEHRAIDVLALDEALRRLAADDERAASVVELRFFGALSLPQVARALGVPLRTVERDWKWARAFLHARLA
jgi:RNA polymerase sigma-70 factor, ECF subfamily